MTADEARTKRAATYHRVAMEESDEADVVDGHRKISCLLSASRSEFLAASQVDMMDTPHEPTRSVFYRSAAALAHQASIELARQGLRGAPDPQLERELNYLAGEAKTWGGP